MSLPKCDFEKCFKTNARAAQIRRERKFVGECIPTAHMYATKMHEQPNVYKEPDQFINLLLCSLLFLKNPGKLTKILCIFTSRLMPV